MTAIILLVSLFVCLPIRQARPAHPADELMTQEPIRSAFKCSQSAAEQEPLIREAVENHYRVRRVEFVGNARTRDNVLRRRIALQEGEIFTRENLVRSLESVSRLKRIIYPVEIDDVILHLDRPEKIVDFTICFREKRPHRGTKRSLGNGAG